VKEAIEMLEGALILVLALGYVALWFFAMVRGLKGLHW